MITTHVLDTSRGKPASGLLIVLEVQLSDGAWQEIGRGATDQDGRLRDLWPTDARRAAGVYRLMFETGAYFAAQGSGSFYPQVSIAFKVNDASDHYHVPLLLSPYGYSTYRGS